MFHNSLALDRLSAGCFVWANNGPSFNSLPYDDKLENEYLKLIRNSDIVFSNWVGGDKKLKISINVNL